MGRVIRFGTPRLTRPPGLDLVLALLFAAAMFTELFLRDRPLTAPTSTAFVVAALPVLLRRQAPVAAMVLGYLTLFGISLTTDGIYSTIPFPAVVCAYTLADLRGRRAAVIATVAGLPIVLFLLQAYSPHALFSWITAQNLALVVLPAALGVAAHDRRAYTEALVERAQVAERNQEEMARRRVSEERLRIARDVHDVVAHAMVTINVQAGVGAYLVRSDPDEAHSTLRTIKQVSGDALTDLRSMLGILRNDDETDSPLGGPALPVQGLAALDDLTEGLRRAGIELTVEIDPEARSLPASVDSTAFRIVQEALTNTLRHAGPTSARIAIAHHGDRVRVAVTDAGGAPAEHLTSSGSGSGISGMRERTTALGGSLTAGPRPGGGWQVVAWLPLSTEAVTR